MVLPAGFGVYRDYMALPWPGEQWHPECSRNSRQSDSKCNFADLRTPERAPMAPYLRGLTERLLAVASLHPSKVLHRAASGET